MQFQSSIYIAPLVLAALISSGVAAYAWSRRTVRAATALALMGAAIAEWSLTYALEIAGVDLGTKVFWAKAQYLGIVAGPLLWFVFCYNHSNQARQLSARTLALLSIVPVLTFALVLTTEWHGLLWQNIHLEQAGGFSVVGVSHGLWFWVHFAYSYALLLAGTLLMLLMIRRHQGLYRGQAVALLVAVAAPWVGNVIYLSGLSPIPSLDLTPFAFTLTTVSLAWGIFGFRLVDLSPLARDLVVEEMREGMVVVDVQGRIADINPAAEKIIGTLAAHAIGKPAAVVLNRWPHLIERFADAVETVDEFAVGEGDTQRWYELRISPLRDWQRQVAGRVIILRNVTYRKRAEEQLRQLSRAVDSSPVSIVITDRNGSIQYVNPKFTQVTGYTQPEVLGKNPSILKTDLTPAEVHRELWAAITSGGEWHGEFCNRKKNGELYWEAASISPISDANGEPTHFVAVKEDITERKRAEEALEVARDQAMEASRLKSQLLAKVSHELRTPLGAIFGYAELLQQGTFGPLESKQKDAVVQIMDGANYLNTTVGELLDQAQIEARRLILKIEPFAPEDLLQQVRLHLDVLAQRKGLTLSAELDPALPPVLNGDLRRLQQILINLAGNAIKFTNTGGVKIHIGPADPDHWSMKVSDTGVGIPAEARAFIFEPFRQADNAITHENRGSGLGLSIARQLVELMGGRIALESETGQGSTFTVTLPFIDPLKAGTMSKPLALIVEDDPQLGQIFSYALENDFVTEIIGNGDKALEWLATATPEVIVLDLNLPGASGREIMAFIRRESRLVKTHVVLTTADALQADFLRDEADIVLLKPVSPAQLRELASRMSRGF